MSLSMTKARMEALDRAIQTQLKVLGAERIELLLKHTSHARAAAAVLAAEYATLQEAQTIIHERFNR